MVLGFSKKCEIKMNDTFGRYVIAADDIRPGDVLLMDAPILVVPLIGSESLCYNCFSSTKDLCKECKIFPLCHRCHEHDTLECTFLQSTFSTNNKQVPRNSGVYTLLKALLFLEKSKNDIIATEMLEMESHTKYRRGTNIWTDYERDFIEPFLNCGIADKFKNVEVNANFLQKILGIFDVNAFELRSLNGNEPFRGLFTRGSLFGHQCVANANVTIDAKNTMKVYANTVIPKGEMICVCYTNPLWGTDERRNCLLNGKYFDCKCRRCEDPTELGTYMSAIKCTSCPIGYQIKTKSQWMCENCKYIMPAEDVDELLTEANSDLLSADGDIRNLEMTIKKYAKKFHKNHYILLDLKQNVAAILRSFCMNPLFTAGRELLERKIQLCGDILAVLDVIQPGISRLKGIALYECFTPFADLARLNFSQKKISSDEFLLQMKRAEEMLRDSIKVLLYEPPDSPEGQLAKNMFRELKDLQSDIKDMSKE